MAASSPLTPPLPAKAPPYSILFVCLGNICRSPMAHGYFQRHLTTLSPSARSLFATVDSAGTGAYHAGDLSDSRTLQVLSSHGINNFRHPARKVRADDFADFDIILGMDVDNYEDLVAMRRRIAGRKGEDGGSGPAYIGMFGDFAGWAPGGKNSAAGAGEEVDDPYYGGAEGFNVAYGQMERFSRGLVAWVEAVAAAHSYD